jgi:thioredoxin reductase (NADPH)
MEIMDKFREHAESEGAIIKIEDVKKIEKKENGFRICTEDYCYTCAAVIIATGTKHRKLGVPGEDDFVGKGVSYCATCDGAFFKDKIVAVVGGSNSAAMGAQILSQYAKKVYIIYRGEQMRAETARVQLLQNDPKIEFKYRSNITRILGTKKVESAELDTDETIKVDGVFVEIGGLPLCELAQQIGVKLSEDERINVTTAMETNVPGVYGAGDVTSGSNKFNQIITAAAEGAIAALSAFNYIKHRKPSDN